MSVGRDLYAHVTLIHKKLPASYHPFSQKVLAVRDRTVRENRRGMEIRRKKNLASARALQSHEARHEAAARRSHQVGAGRRGSTWRLKFKWPKRNARSSWLLSLHPFIHSIYLAARDISSIRAVDLSHT